jgi:methionine synthase II (cobalamin-independent)
VGLHRADAGNVDIEELFMNTQHTPGPWTYSRSAVQYGDWRFYVAQAEGAPYTPHYSDVATLIAETVNDERRSIQEANARLIAAAPDLLEALKRLMGGTTTLQDAQEAAQQARAAIAKATGEAA